MRPLVRDRLDVATPGAVGHVLRGMDFDILVNVTACNLVDQAADEAAEIAAHRGQVAKPLGRHSAARAQRVGQDRPPISRSSYHVPRRALRAVTAGTVDGRGTILFHINRGQGLEDRKERHSAAQSGRRHRT